jgi:alkylated DNA repair dioxygenase AlkB
MLSSMQLDLGRSQLLGAGDSMYFSNIWPKEESQRLFRKLQAELVYVDRSTMTFSIFGRTIELPRDKGFFGDVVADGSSYPLYRYGGKSYPVVLPWTATTRAIRDQLAAATGQYCNHLVANRYRSGADHIGLHRDKDRDFEIINGAAASVLTVSFGASRTFVLKSADGEVESFEIAGGSLFVLGPKTNKAGGWKHSIAKTSAFVEERISLTFRSIKTRFDVASGEVIEC